MAEQGSTRLWQTRVVSLQWGRGVRLGCACFGTGALQGSALQATVSGSGCAQSCASLGTRQLLDLPTTPG